MKRFMLVVLLISFCSASANSYQYRNEFKGMNKILLVADLDLSDFPTAPLEELQKYTLNILHKNLQENLPKDTEFFRQEYPDHDDVDTMISVDLLVGEYDENTYYGDVVLEVRRLVYLAEVETDLPFWSVVYSNRYIIRGSIDSLEEQLEETVEPMVLRLIEDYNEAQDDLFDYHFDLDNLLLQEAFRSHSGDLHACLKRLPSISEGNLFLSTFKNGDRLYKKSLFLQFTNQFLA